VIFGQREFTSTKILKTDFDAFTAIIAARAEQKNTFLLLARHTIQKGRKKQEREREREGGGEIICDVLQFPLHNCFTSSWRTVSGRAAGGF
jgi:hypothetical protein